jgi:formylglycine-generating enzyme required for sulfatase activity
LAAAIGADPKDERLALLKTFREEFVAITPGEGEFPAQVKIGRDEGGSKHERPATTVTFTQPLAVARYEVPQNLWQAVTGDNPSKWKGKWNSVEMVSYDDCVAFCEAVTTMLREAGLIEAGEEVRLPTEAEWEYFARAGTDTVYSFGDDATKLDDYAWHTGNAAGNDPPVGAKKPNAWGLYDIHGYLWEWCSDDWTDDHRGLAEPGFDPAAARAGNDSNKKVLRGGSWKDAAEKLTSSFRRGEDRGLKDDAIGLRCVLATKKISDPKP